MADLASDLQALGLTQNEALAWLCLLRADEAFGLTGYEVAARTSVPRSAVYAVLRRLASLGLTFPTSEKPARFAAIPPKEAIARMRTRALDQFADLEERLRRLPARQRPEPVWIVGGYDALIGAMSARVQDARRSVWLSVWQRELERLRPAVTGAVARGLHVLVHSLDPDLVPVQGASTWVDVPPAADPRRGWRHKVVAVIDGDEALLGGSEPLGGEQAVHTRNAAVVELATNHLVLDVTLTAHRHGRDCRADVARLMRAAPLA